MPFVRWDGDWSHQQAAMLDDARVYVFPIPDEAMTDPVARIDALCEKLINQPSDGAVTAKAWTVPLIGKPVVLAATTDFPQIRSSTSPDAAWGHIRERDVGFFALVEVSYDGVKKIHALNPYLWVDNPAGVIMGREIFGFPKVLADIGWNESRLEFDVSTLVFPTHAPATLAENREVLRFRRTSIPWWLSAVFGWASVQTLPLPASGGGAASMQAVAQALLDALFGSGTGAAAGISAFDEIPLILLKQYRSVTPGSDAAYQEVVRGTFTVSDISGFQVYPKFLFWASPLVLELTKHASIDIGEALGLSATTELGRAFRIDCKLKLEGSSIP